MDVGLGFGEYGNTCSPSSIALMSKLRNVDCGKHIPGTLYPFSLGLYANTTTADSWDFQIRNVQDTNYVEDIFGLPTRKFQLLWLVIYSSYTIANIKLSEQPKTVYYNHGGLVFCLYTNATN